MRVSSPNILFILVDCLRSRSIFDPSRRAQVPTIRGLIARGVGFSKCVATTTTTSPSMATIFTGVLPFVHGIRSLRGYKLNPSTATLAEVLRQHGYYTHAEATGPVVRQMGFDRGFESFNHRMSQENLYQRDFWERLQRTLETLPTDRPWFFYLHLWELHDRFLPKSFDRFRYGRTRYERALSALDQTRLPSILNCAGPDTLIILTGDHGDEPRFDRLRLVARRLRLRRITRSLKSHWSRGHHVYEHLVVVPLLMAGPGVPVGRLVRSAVRHVDLFPTLLELAGVDNQPRNRGIGESLVPLFTGVGEDRPGYSEAVGVSMHGGPEKWLVSVRHGGWKYVKRASGGEICLWRLPDERRNLARQNPEIVAEMEGILSGMQQRASLIATGEGLSAAESAEVEAHLRDLGYLD